MAGKFAVYYTLNEGDSRERQLTSSIESLRSANRSLPIHLFLFGSFQISLVRKWSKMATRVVQEPALPAETARFAHWLPLKHFEEKKIIHARSNILFLKDPLALFRKYKSRDLYALPFVGAHFFPEHGLKRQEVNLEAFKLISSSLKILNKPLINASLFVINSPHKIDTDQILQFSNSLWGAFRTKRVPFPGFDWGALEPLVSSLALAKVNSGLIEKLSFGPAGIFTSCTSCEPAVIWNNEGVLDLALAPAGLLRPAPRRRLGIV
jgi:hypothetical protein